MTLEGKTFTALTGEIPGDEIFTVDGEWKSVNYYKYIEGPIKTYNLWNVEDTNTFFANGLLAHNRCFVAGTMISTPNGLVPIEELTIDDEVNTFIHAEGELTSNKIKTLVSHAEVISTQGPVATASALHEKDSIFEVRTENNIVFVTGNHPFVVYDKDSEGPVWENIKDIKVGEEVYVEDGSREEIIYKEKTDRDEKTYNLEVSEIHTYVANGFRVHNAYGDSKRQNNSNIRPVRPKKRKPGVSIMECTTHSDCNPGESCQQGQCVGFGGIGGDQVFEPHPSDSKKRKPPSPL